MTKVLILMERHEPTLAALQDRYPQVEIQVGPYMTDPQATLEPELLQDIDILFCEFPPANLSDCRQLRWVQIASVGYSQLYRHHLHQRSIAASNARGIFDLPIAEWNLMMILAWHRHLLDMLANQQAGIWDRHARFQAELSGLTVGFWGYGGIARETTRLLKQMGLVVWVMTRDGTTKPRQGIWRVPHAGDPEGNLPDRVFSPDEAATFLGGLDYLCLSMPLTATTRGLIGERELRQLQSHAVLLNPARAQLIDQDIFERCLREGWIRGCSLDVHYAYPCPPEHPIWSLPNLIATPHISGSAASTHFLSRVYTIFAENLARFLAGKPLLNQLTDQQLAGA